MIDLENAVACVQALTIPWPNGHIMTCELVYHITPDGKVHNKGLSEEGLVALQALVDYRKPLESIGKGSSLEAMSEQEEAIFDALSDAILTPGQRTERTVLELVSEAHTPVAINSDFSMGNLEICEDGTPLITVIESGPNWSNRYTLYVLELSPVVCIVQAYTPFGEHCINRNFQTVEKTPDDSGQFYDFPAHLARLWQDAV